ncbi:hypothetical protein SS50377_28256 [Spironucleus salmonicida]|uniref:Uncharacterized protein n=1 Tax=Spironucleus salmonicida TaxID=348837 RepID=V6LV27_9EUKA|nr:hypothetical protein SS50377_28256 [Spironucleus salmonicida]|eukprot:EST48435.1 Hypothetical protein SS50377_11385 [Spironucleus salmonicida]
MTLQKQKQQLNIIQSELNEIKHKQYDYIIPGYNNALLDSIFQMQRKIINILENSQVQQQDLHIAIQNKQLVKLLKQVSFESLILQFLDNLSDKDFESLTSDINKATIAVFMNQDCLNMTQNLQLRPMFLDKSMHNYHKQTNHYTILNYEKISNFIRTSFDLEQKLYKYASSIQSQNSVDYYDKQILESIKIKVLSDEEKYQLKYPSFFALLDYSFGASGYEQIVSLTSQGENVLLRKIGLSANMKSLRSQKRLPGQIRQITTLNLSYLGLLLNSLGIINLLNIEFNHCTIKNSHTNIFIFKSFKYISQQFEFYEDLIDPMNMFFSEEISSYQRINYDYEEEIINQFLNSFYSIQSGQVELSFEYVPYECLDIMLKVEEKRDSLIESQHKIVSCIKKIFHKISIDLIKYFVESNFINDTNIFNLYEKINDFLNDGIILDQGKGSLLGLLESIKNWDSKSHNIDDLFMNIFPYGIFQKGMLENMHRDQVISIVIKAIQQFMCLNTEVGSPGYYLSQNIRLFFENKPLVDYDKGKILSFLNNYRNTDTSTVEIQQGTIVMFEQSRIFTIVNNKQCTTEFQLNNISSFVSQLVTESIDLDVAHVSSQLLKKLPQQIQISSQSIQDLISKAVLQAQQNVFEREGLAFLDSPPSFQAKNCFQRFTFKDYFYGSVCSVLEKRILWCINWQLQNQQRQLFDRKKDLEDFISNWYLNTSIYQNKNIIYDFQKPKQFSYKNSVKLILAFQNYLIQALICQFNFEMELLRQTGIDKNYILLINHLCCLDIYDPRKKEIIDFIISNAQYDINVNSIPKMSNYYYELFRYVEQIIQIPLDILSGRLFIILLQNVQNIDIQQYDTLNSELKENSLKWSQSTHCLLEKQNSLISILYTVTKSVPFQIYMELYLDNDLELFKQKIEDFILKLDFNQQKLIQYFKFNIQVNRITNKSQLGLDRYQIDKNQTNFNKLKLFLNEYLLKIIVLTVMENCQQNDLNSEYGRNQLLFQFYFTIQNLSFYFVKDQQHIKQIQQTINNIQLLPQFDNITPISIQKQIFLQIIISNYFFNHFDQFIFSLINSKFAEQIFDQEKKIKLSIEKSYKRLLNLAQNKQSYQEKSNFQLNDLLATFEKSVQLISDKVQLFELTEQKVQLFIQQYKIKVEKYDMIKVISQQNLVFELTEAKLRNENELCTQKIQIQKQNNTIISEIVEEQQSSIYDQNELQIIHYDQTSKQEKLSEGPKELILSQKLVINLEPIDDTPNSDSSSFMSDLHLDQELLLNPTFSEARILPKNITFSNSLIFLSNYEPEKIILNQIFYTLITKSNYAISKSLLPLDSYSILCYCHKVPLGTIFLPFRPKNQISLIQSLFTKIPEIQILIADYILLMPSQPFDSYQIMTDINIQNYNLTQIFHPEFQNVDILRIFNLVGLSIATFLKIIDNEDSNFQLKFKVYTLKIPSPIKDQNGNYGATLTLSCGHGISGEFSSLEKGEMYCTFCGQNAVPQKLQRKQKERKFEMFDFTKYVRKQFFESPILIVQPEGAVLKYSGQFGYFNQFLDYFLD